MASRKYMIVVLHDGLPLPRALDRRERNTIAAATSCPWTPPPLPRASLCCRRRRHFALSTLTFLSTFCGTLAMAHAAGNSVEAVIDLGAEPSFEVGAWPVASDDDDGRW